MLLLELKARSKRALCRFCLKQVAVWRLSLPDRGFADVTGRAKLLLSRGPERTMFLSQMGPAAGG